MDDEILKTPEEELFAQIGRELLGKQAVRPSRREMIEEGRRWFDANLARLSEVICDRMYKRLLAVDSDVKDLFINVADIVASVTVGVPPILVSTLILKIGLKKLRTPTSVPKD